MDRGKNRKIEIHVPLQKFACSQTSFVVENYLRVNRSNLLKVRDYVSQDFNSGQRTGFFKSWMTSRATGFAHLRKLDDISETFFNFGIIC
jgi:hypothetical protein